MSHVDRFLLRGDSELSSAKKVESSYVGTDSCTVARIRFRRLTACPSSRLIDSRVDSAVTNEAIDAAEFAFEFED